MAKFLNTKKSVSAIEDMIKDADQKLILISPFLQLSKDFRELLTYRNKKDKITTIIYGKSELKPDELKFLESLQFVILKYKEDLHAKCYLNDDKMIITSLNFYEFSMTNNKEMGVLIEKSNPNDRELFDEALKEVDFINQTSERFVYKIQNSQTMTINKPDDNEKLTEKGYCIRCGTRIKLSSYHPYCLAHFKSWNEYKDPTYEEKTGVCHMCGKPNTSSMKKPACRNCFQKNKSLFKNHYN